MPIRDLKGQIARLPEQPGVYLYSNGQGETLYVGKARVLRDRVRSYLVAYGTSPRIDALLDEAERLEVIVTDSVVEALALGDRVGVLDDGRLIACETPDRLARTTDPMVRQFLDALVPGARASTVDRLPSTVAD